MITSWSHSKDTDFKKCKFLAWLKHDQKIPEPIRPLPPGKTEHANERGSRIHDGLERYVRGDSDEMPIEAEKHFGIQIDMLRTLYADGMVSLEGEWAMNREWETCGWSGDWVAIDLPKDAKPRVVTELPVKGAEGEVVLVKQTLHMKSMPAKTKAKPATGSASREQAYVWVPAWLRLKLDALVFVSPTEAIVIDYKSGRKFGNEIKHGEQLQLYQLVTFLRYPELERVTAELWYVDADEVTRATYTRQQGLRFRASWDKRGHAITSCIEFPPNPNMHSCKYCEYGPWNSGHCQVGKR